MSRCPLCPKKAVNLAEKYVTYNDKIKLYALKIFENYKKIAKHNCFLSKSVHYYVHTCTVQCNERFSPNLIQSPPPSCHYTHRKVGQILITKIVTSDDKFRLVHTPTWVVWLPHLLHTPTREVWLPHLLHTPSHPREKSGYPIFSTHPRG